MDRTTTKLPVFYLIIMALLGWFALVSQLVLIIQNRQTSIAETIIRYFSFFTILTNLIVALCVSSLLLRPGTKLGNFFSRPATLTAITVYIVIVGVVYNAILRFLWHPQGLQFVTDELLHTVIPILFLLLWIRYVPKSGLEYKNIFSWLIYPLIYTIYTFIRGAITGEYPYPFIDVVVLGYTRVLMNAGGLFIAFSGLSLFLIVLGKSPGRK